MPKIRDAVEIRLVGFGGQGVVLAGLLLGQAAVNDGWFAAGANSYGAQARGSACRSDLVISPAPIDYPHVERAHLLVAMSQAGYDTFEGHVADDGRIFYDSGQVTPSGDSTRQMGLDVTAISVRELGDKQVANMVWVGVVGGATDWFSPQALERAARQHVSGAFWERNQQAMKKGIELGRSWKEVAVAGKNG